MRFGLDEEKIYDKGNIFKVLLKGHKEDEVQLYTTDK